ncbi:hypothetical protein H6P81_002759 [Aristolochia fimbriata]|uniref:Uncharacterized protein n=1 Tax=Aristolochia fimbriata TaxID=158543 RepID=A0AAV7FEI5_ARIFI|nr:hypothetical protein H6P81_002759 [Aristolochia fimbriata]
MRITAVQEQKGQGRRLIKIYGISTGSSSSFRSAEKSAIEACLRCQNSRDYWSSTAYYKYSLNSPKRDEGLIITDVQELASRGRRHSSWLLKDEIEAPPVADTTRKDGEDFTMTGSRKQYAEGPRNWVLNSLCAGKASDSIRKQRPCSASSSQASNLIPFRNTNRHPIIKSCEVVFFSECQNGQEKLKGTEADAYLLVSVSRLKSGQERYGRSEPRLRKSWSSNVEAPA